MGAKCRSCGAAIIWATSATTGKHVPLNSDPDPKGRLVLVPPGMTEVRTATDEDIALKRDLHTSHFATCPDAPAWRKR